MKEFKGTQGPWGVHKSRTSGFCITKYRDPVVGCVDEFDHYGSIPKKADAYLIAAAPDLLEALKDLFAAGLEAYMSYDGKDDEVEAVAKAKAAIEKALNHVR